MTRKERIISNLSEYGYISKFLGNAIRKRLEIRGYTRGMLTAHLLDPTEWTKPDLNRLDQELQLGKNTAKILSIFSKKGRYQAKTLL